MSEDATHAEHPPAPGTDLERLAAEVTRAPGDGLQPTGFVPMDLGGLHAVELAGLLHELTARVLSADGFTQAVDRLAVFAASALPSTVRCSVTLIGEGGPPILAGHGAPGRGLDELQHSTGSGPSLDAARTRALITALDLPGDPRWPLLGERARLEDVRAVAAIPLDVQRSEVGSLSLYLTDPAAIGPDLLLTAMAIVNQAGVLLRELRRREGLREGAAVDRAAGIIIAQRGCGVHEAYDVLQETAQRLGINREAVADRLIAAVARNAS